METAEQSQTPQDALKPVSIEDTECQLALRKAIDSALNGLIQAGADKVLLLKTVRNPKGELALSRSQLQNVISVAEGTESREVVTNFIRYQMGRKGGDAWRESKINGRLSFGREVIADLEGIEGYVGAVNTAVAKVSRHIEAHLRARGKQTDTVALDIGVRARLITLYLGYLNRTYAYCVAMDKEDQSCWDDVREVAKR